MEKIILAQLSVRKENIKQFLEITNEIVLKSNKEKGCISYKLFSEFNRQNEFIIFEKYINENAVSMHKSSIHYKKYISIVQKFLTKEPIIDIY